MTGSLMRDGKVKRLETAALVALVGAACLGHAEAPAEAKRSGFIIQHWQGHLLNGPGTVTFAVRLRKVSKAKLVATSVRHVIVDEQYKCTSQGHTEGQMVNEPFVTGAGKYAAAPVNKGDGRFRIKGQNQSYSFDITGEFAGGNRINPGFATGLIFTLRQTLDNGETCQPTLGRTKQFKSHTA